MAPTFANYLDRRIYKAIEGHTCAQPQTLVGILAYVDSQEKMVLTREELSGGLTRLMEAGLIAESNTHLFYEMVGATEPSAFSGISPDEHELACRDYTKWFDDQLKQDDPGEGFTRQKLIIRWKLNDNSYPTEDDEDATEAFAEAIEPAIAKSGLAEINGFECGSGLIDILIFGKETDDDMEDLYAMIVDTFRSYGCPTGSCIIKCYGEAEKRREVICDAIA
jgi:hypothetical protein